MPCRRYLGDAHWKESGRLCGIIFGSPSHRESVAVMSPCSRSKQQLSCGNSRLSWAFWLLFSCWWRDGRLLRGNSPTLTCKRGSFDFISIVFSPFVKRSAYSPIWTDMLPHLSQVFKGWGSIDYSTASLHGQVVCDVQPRRAEVQRVIPRRQRRQHQVVPKVHRWKVGSFLKVVVGRRIHRQE